MRKFALVLLAAGGFLTGCVAYEVPARNPGPYYSERDRDRDGIPDRADRDRDGDGVRNSQDSRPDNPRRF